jgi:hypothetical protein
MILSEKVAGSDFSVVRGSVPETRLPGLRRIIRIRLARGSIPGIYHGPDHPQNSLIRSRHLREEQSREGEPSGSPESVNPCPQVPIHAASKFEI